MKKGLVVLLPQDILKTGDRVFWYDHAETGDVSFDEQWVRLYQQESDTEPFTRLHISRVKIVTEEMTTTKWGSVYLKDEFSQFQM